jgi:predicted AlkP superfamily phosphohydrolase/phosphomutase/thioredoxin-like negative regulator of GroEL
MKNRPATRLLVVGWDAADWLVLDPLLARGEMPVLARLLQAGTRSDLQTLEPILSPLLWTSAATGRTPDVHGILNFAEPRADGCGICLASSTSRKVKALWNMATQHGLSVQCTSWYASHPAEPVRGTVVSNMLMQGDPGTDTGAWPLAADCVHPPDFAATAALARVGRAAFRRDHLAEVLPGLSGLLPDDERVAQLSQLMATAASVDAVARAAMAREPWDLAMVFFESIDTVGHAFMQYRPPRLSFVAEAEVRRFGGVIDAVYRWHDRALGRLLAAAGPDVTVLLLSDHGFHSGELRPNLGDLPPERRMEKEASWHRPVGIFVASGPGVRAAAQLATPSILDVTPTALALLGMPAGQDFEGRVLTELLLQTPPAPIPSWEHVPGDAGLHAPDRQQDPFEAVDAIRQLVDLGYLAALPADATEQIELVRRESLFNLGVHLTSRQRFRAALPHFEALVAQRPEELRYRICLASCLGAAGEHARVVALISGWDAGEVPELLMVLARSQLEVGQAEAARATTDRAIARLAKAPALRVGLAECLLRQGRHREARDLYGQVSRQDPSAVPPWLGLAMVQLGERDWEAAATTALDLLAQHPAQPEAHWLLGLALAWYGDLAAAAQSLDLGLRFAPNHLPLLQTAAVVAAAQQDRARAQALHRRVAQAASRTPPVVARPLPFEAEVLAKHLGVPAPEP